MPVSRLLAIASVERTGSTALCSILRQTGVAGTPIEYLNIRSVNFDRFRAEHGLPRIRTALVPMSLVRRAAGRVPWRDFGWFSRRSWIAYLRKIAEVNATPNGVFGVKMHWSQYQRHMLALGLDAGFWGAPVTWVRITRADEVRQAISFVRASQTQSWNSDMGQRAEPWYDADAIRAALEHIEAENLAWDHYLAGLGGEVLAVTHEELLADRAGVVGRILERIGEPTVPVPAPGTRPQSDASNDLWAERFVAEHPEHAPRRTMPPRSTPPGP